MAGYEVPECLGYRLVPVLGGVLVAQRGRRAGVAHSVHQLAQARYKDNAGGVYTAPETFATKTDAGRERHPAEEPQ